MYKKIIITEKNHSCNAEGFRHFGLELVEQYSNNKRLMLLIETKMKNTL